MIEKFHAPTPRLLIVLLFALLWGCSSTPPEPVVDHKQDYDFTKIKTVAFMPRQLSGEGAANIMISDMQRERIRAALAQAMEAKGIDVIADPKQADALLTWHLVVEEKTDVRTYNSGMTYGAGYGYYGRRSMYSCWNCGTNVQVRQYTQGTFIVDVVDQGLGQSVWRSVIQSKLKGDGMQDQAELNASADRIMAKFPPL